MHLSLDMSNSDGLIRKAARCFPGECQAASSPDAHTESECANTSGASRADKKVSKQQLRKRSNYFLRNRALPQRAQRIINFSRESHVLAGERIGFPEQNSS